MPGAAFVSTTLTGAADGMMRGAHPTTEEAAKMESKRMSKTRRTRPDESSLLHESGNGFDVVVEQVVGSIVFTDTGTQSPVEAAFSAIGRHIEDTNTSGTFRFPHAHGGELTVRVKIPLT